MVRSICLAGLLFVVMASQSGWAMAAQTIACPEGFTKILEQSGQAACRRSQSVASSDLADTVSKLWWDNAHCNGNESDRQTGVSQNQTGEWTVTMRFWCSGF